MDIKIPRRILTIHDYPIYFSPVRLRSAGHKGYGSIEDGLRSGVQAFFFSFMAKLDPSESEKHGALLGRRLPSWPTHTCLSIIN